MLGRYEIVRPVAAGGMGAVWLGRIRGSHGFEQLVAIKTILPEYAREEGFRELFLEEARLVARIRHPNVAQVIDLGEEGETLYCVMEWVDGRSLDGLVGALRARGTTVPLPIALRIVSDACLGAHAAHELCGDGAVLLGVVHRDISPQNIMVAESGTTKLVDFGIARARAGLEQESQERIVRGKIAYMAPEQAEGKVVDRRADVWSLGGVLFSLVTGGPVVSTRGEMVSLIVSKRVPALREDLPRRAREAIVEALVVDPGQRAASALDLHRALEGALADLGPPTTSADVARFLAVTLPRTITYSERIDLRMGVEAGQETKGEPAILRAAGQTTETPPADPVQLIDARANGVEAATRLVHAATGGGARVLIAPRHDERAALRVFEEGGVDCVLIEPVTEERVARAKRAAIARAARRRPYRRRPASKEMLQGKEEVLRRELESLGAKVEHARTTRAALANEGRLSVIGEVEARRADATEIPLSLVVYRPWEPTQMISPAEAAKLVAALEADAVVSEEGAEWVAVAPGQTAESIRERLAGLDARIGTCAVHEHVRGESFVMLLALARAEVM
jgi:serine/threonine-protein kinase